jgi:hypothetical protein
MKDRRARMRHPHLLPAVVGSLVLGLACLTGGCGTGPDSEAASSKRSNYAQSLKGQMKQQAALQKAGSAKRPGGRR